MKFQINESTKVTINLVILCSLLAFAVTASAWAATYKTRTENRLEKVEESSEKNAENINEIYLRQNSQDIDLVEIKTDLKWIRSYLEGRDEQ